jgi:hypothetical protein
MRVVFCLLALMPLLASAVQLSSSVRRRAKLVSRVPKPLATAGQWTDQTTKQQAVYDDEDFFKASAASFLEEAKVEHRRASLHLVESIAEKKNLKAAAEWKADAKGEAFYEDEDFFTHQEGKVPLMASPKNTLLEGKIALFEVGELSVRDGVAPKEWKADEQQGEAYYEDEDFFKAEAGKVPAVAKKETALVELFLSAHARTGTLKTVSKVELANPTAPKEWKEDAKAEAYYEDEDFFKNEEGKVPMAASKADASESK